MILIECSCGEEALPSNWIAGGIGRLWYCFNCQIYLDVNGQKQPYKVQQGKYQLELVKVEVYGNESV
mgnify:CR=1 FL=1